jgi:integrase
MNASIPLRIVPCRRMRRAASKGAAYPGQHKAILDPELWQIVQDKLAANRQERALVVGAEARMIQRRAAELGTRVRIGCHTFRATGITAYLEAGGTLENAQAMAAHESPRTTKLYDRRGDEITLDEVERITI